tara:strand:+ start:11130 stop:12065 length:936 start_codon:yes stop_codon:yes gene_type:complete
MKIDLTKRKILVTGGAGFLGSHIIEKLLSIGVNLNQIVIPRKDQVDLRNLTNCLEIVKDIDIIFHIAGNIGGIGYNQKYPGSILYDNLIMGIQLLEAARKSNIKKFLTIGTTCSYPNETFIPFKEENLWDGYPSDVTAPYGLAKKMLLVQSQAYHKQYNFNAIYLIPTNLYGPKDNYFQDKSHVIPALIKKVVDAKINNHPKINVWGRGTATREFLYVKDAARAIVTAMEKYNKPEPVNLGTGEEVSIKTLLSKIVNIIGFSGKIEWEKDKPEGQPRRSLNIDKANNEFGFKATTSLEVGLKKTIDWYLNK